VGLGTMLTIDPSRDAEATTDAFAGDLLQLFGMTADEARTVCSRALPEI
jgi:hypothetical protein